MLYSKTEKCLFLPSSCRKFTKIGQILGQKRKVNRFKRVKIIQTMSSDNKKFQLQIGNRKIARKIPQSLEMKQYFSIKHVSQRKSLKRNVGLLELNKNEI